MELALATDWGILENSPESMEEQLQKLNAAGVTHVHWAYDWDFEYAYSKWEMIQIKELLDKYNIKVKGVHATEGNTRCRVKDGKPIFLNRTRMRDNRKDITSPHEYNRLAGVELVQNRVDLAHLLGATEIVLHLVVPYEDFENIPGFKEKWYEQVFKSFDALEPYCKAMGVRIAIENMICTPAPYQFEKLDRLFARYDKDYMGFCCDTGHAALVTDAVAFLERYYDRLIAMHLDDNHGVNRTLSEDPDGAVQKSDAHIIPYQGVCDWDKICEYIAKSPYTLPLTLEVTVPHSTPEEERQGLLDLIKAGERLTNKVLEYRAKLPESITGG